MASGYNKIQDNTIQKIRTLISENKLNAAIKLTKSYLSLKPNNPELWFLRSVIALKQNQHELATGFIDKAITISKKPEYIKHKAIIKMDLNEFEEAMRLFKEESALKNDVESMVYAGCCGFLLEDPESSVYLSHALKSDRKKTKEMLNDFYHIFFELDPLIGDGVKKMLKKKIDEL